MSQKYLWSFDWDCGRSGSLDGLFVATEEEVEKAIGQYVYFGEVLGKHSEVYGTIDEGDIYKVDVSPEAVSEVAKHLGTNWSGFNPLDYVRVECDCCGERMENGETTYTNDSYDTMCESCYEESQGEEYEGEDE